MTADIEPGLGQNLRATTAAGAGAALLVGIVVLSGWALSLPALTQFLSGRSAMQPLTALCAIVAGVGVLATSRSGQPQPRALLVGGLVFVAAVQALIEHIWGADFGIDRQLFPHAVAAQPAPYAFPGRMAEPTAAAFTLVGIALLLARVRGRIAGLLFSACATVVLLLVTIALLGHLFRVAPLAGVLGFTQVSVPTALALGGLAVGLLSLRHDAGWVSLLTRKTVGAAAARWLLPVVLVVPVGVAWFAFQGSEAGLYPPDFRLALITAVTIVLLAVLTVWGTTQLDRLDTVRRTAEALRESEATLRAFFNTEGLFASIIERTGNDVRYMTANKAFASFFGRDDIAGLTGRDLLGSEATSALVEQLKAIEERGAAVSLEHPVETPSGTRWFAATISPVWRELRRKRRALPQPRSRSRSASAPRRTSSFCSRN